MQAFIKILPLIFSLCISCLNSQNITYSRAFVSLTKSLPIAILNPSPHYFYVLRNNKLAHDFSVERRKKSSAEILNFTPLKLDSINANWFNYSHLDFLFFEYNYKTYFVFEKVTNLKKNLFMKVIDTLGKSTGFIELMSLDYEKNTVEFNLEFKRSNGDELLVIASQRLFNYTTKKTITLFNLSERKKIWVKKLAPEIGSTGYSTHFAVSPAHDLYYFYIKSQIVGTKRKYLYHSQINVPIYQYDSLILVRLSMNNQNFVRKPINVFGLSSLSSLSLEVFRDEVIVQMQYTEKEKQSSENECFFLIEKWQTDLDRLIASASSPLDTALNKQLTFYDGTDTDLAAEKDYSHFGTYHYEEKSYHIAERKEDQFYKELLVWETDLNTCSISNQYLIPRKILTSRTWSKYDGVGEATAFCLNKLLYVYQIEAKSNFDSDPNQFNYSRFKKKTNERNGNLVLYHNNTSGVLEKKLIHVNDSFNYIPLRYEVSNTNDAVLYTTSGRQEKFIILDLAPH